jgi:hypothetical protein
MASPFSSVSSARPKRSVFDLSYSKKFTADFSWLYPVMCDEVVPGDTFKIGFSTVVRFNPLVAPIMHEVTAKAYYFFVPYRILDDKWEEIITGGYTGTSTVVPPSPSSQQYFNTNYPDYPLLTDYLGFPTDLDINTYDSSPIKPIQYPYLAYFWVFMHYFLTPDWGQGFVNLGGLTPTLMPIPAAWLNRDSPQSSIFRHVGYLMSGAWQRDYFTTSLPSQQRGTQPALPISGVIPVYATGATPSDPWLPLQTVDSTGFPRGYAPYFVDPNSSVVTTPNMAGVQNQPITSGYTIDDIAIQLAGAGTGTSRLAVNLNTAATFNVADIRLAVQIQKWLERNSRSGVRYTEFLRAHFAVAPRDERLDRPEYIGGATFSITTSEVLQTSQTASTPQANMAGHGIAVSSSFIGKYSVNEFGLIIGVLCIRPKPCYEDRLDRQWIKPTRYDFFFPEFQTLSEQGIYMAELRYSALPRDTFIFGFQGRYSEMRFKHDMVCGLFRQSAPANFSYWHMSRHWTIASPPSRTYQWLYHEGFNEPTGAKRVLAAPSQPTFMINWCNHIRAARPIPYEPNPGLLDHY